MSRNIWAFLLITAGLSTVFPHVTKGDETLTRLDVNDVTFLWPVPRNQSDVDHLISGANSTASGDKILPQEVLDNVLSKVKTVELRASSSSPPRKIGIGNGLDKPVNWKVAGMRVDGSAPGSNERAIGIFGSKPQIRLILQPVFLTGNNASVKDMAMHLVFDFSLSETLPPLAAGLPNRSIPDRAKFFEIVKDLVSLKTQLKQGNIDTNVPLNVHPGFAANNAPFRDGVRQFLEKHITAARLKAIAFMGTDSGDPWIFVALSKNGNEFNTVSMPPLDPHMFSRRDNQPVSPFPKNNNLGRSEGVSTAQIMDFDANSHLDDPAVPGSQSPANVSLKLRDIPDIIANPQRVNVFNTDCVSCHSESTRRGVLGLSPSVTRFQLPAGVSGISPDVLPTNEYNVRNLGWFGQSATITMRTANEAAESVDFINKAYLRRQPVSNPLTLVMKVKDDANRDELKRKLAAMHGLPDELNPVNRAFAKLGIVHDARVVFIDKETFAVITTYDNSFDQYAEAFVNEIGEVFDLLLPHVKDAPPLPVREHAQEFKSFVKDHDKTSDTPFYSAYPDLRVQDILTLKRRAESSTP